MKIAVHKSSGIQTYVIPDDKNIATIMQALDYISNHLDNSLAYFKHSACGQGICGRCLIKADGRNVLACVTQLINDGHTLILEPASKDVVRDLVINI